MEVEKKSKVFNEDLRHSRMEEILRSLNEQEGHSIEQMRLLKEMMEMDKKLRSLERVFGALYSKSALLSKTISKLKEKWNKKGAS